MKTKTLITEITHDDLVALLCTALYGSEYLSACYNNLKYKELCDNSTYECFEDRLAHILLNDGEIEVIDTNADDEQDKYDGGCEAVGFRNGGMYYRVTLNDIKTGLQRAFDGDFTPNKGCDYEIAWANKCARYLLSEDGKMEMDACDADALLQIIVFGQIIYG